MANEKDTKTMQTVSCLLIGFALADIIDVIINLANPSVYSNVAVSSNLDAATTNAIMGGMVTAVMVIAIAFNALQIYFGYRGYKLNTTKGISIFCLIIGIIVLIGAIGNLASGVIFQGLFSGCAGVVGILYYVYAKRIMNF